MKLFGDFVRPHPRQKGLCGRNYAGLAKKLDSSGGSGLLYPTFPDRSLSSCQKRIKGLADAYHYNIYFFFFFSSSSSSSSSSSTSTNTTTTSTTITTSTTNLFIFQRLFEKGAIQIIAFCDGPSNYSISGETRSNVLYIQYYTDSLLETAFFTLIYYKLKGTITKTRSCNIYNAVKMKNFS